MLFRLFISYKTLISTILTFPTPPITHWGSEVGYSRWPVHEICPHSPTLIMVLHTATSVKPKKKRNVKTLSNQFKLTELEQGAENRKWDVLLGIRRKKELIQLNVYNILDHQISPTERTSEAVLLINKKMKKYWTAIITKHKHWATIADNSNF